MSRQSKEAPLFFHCITTFLIATTSVLQAQAHPASLGARLPAHATLPVTFTHTVSAAKVKPGDQVRARTLQGIRLMDGRMVPAGAPVIGHVLSAAAFKYDKTPYAQQQAGVLSIQIDSLEFQDAKVSLHVMLRAMANPIATWDATKPQSSDMDPDSTTTQIGGDLLTPSQSEIRNQGGHIIGYNKRNGAYAHLIANTRGALNCDAGDTEQPVSVFSASACGLYGFGDVSLRHAVASEISLTSNHTTPEVYKHSAALLETISADSGK